MNKRISLILRWAVVTAVVTGLLCLAPLLDDGFKYDPWQNAALVAGVAVFGGLLSASIFYFAYLARSLHSLQMAPEELAAGEKVLKQTRGSIVHYRNGKLLDFMAAMGGKLFLTSSRLIFRAHAGQLWRYQILIPLTEVVEVAKCRILGLPGGMVVRSVGVADELFNVGVLESVDEWVAAIHVVCGIGPLVEGRSGDDVTRQGGAAIKGVPGILERGRGIGEQS